MTDRKQMIALDETASELRGIIKDLQSVGLTDAVVEVEKILAYVQEREEAISRCLPDCKYCGWPLDTIGEPYCDERCEMKHEYLTHRDAWEAHCDSERDARKDPDY